MRMSKIAKTWCPHTFETPYLWALKITSPQNLFPHLPWGGHHGETMCGMTSPKVYKYQSLLAILKKTLCYFIKKHPGIWMGALSVNFKYVVI